MIRAAIANGLPFLDLRLIYIEAADCANPIVPSIQGGEKISTAIKAAVTKHDFTQKKTVVFFEGYNAVFARL